MKDVLSLSRSDDKTLLDFGKQKEYYDSVIQSSKGEKKLFQIRKLREALLSSKRVDGFAIKVYEDSVDECLGQRNFQELIKSLARLMELYSTSVDDELPRSNEMKGYLVLYMFCFNSNPNIYAITKQIQKYSIDTDHLTVKWVTSLYSFNYHVAAQLWSKMSEQDRIIARSCFPSWRQEMLERLCKCFFTLPLVVVRRILLIEETDADEEYLRDILPFGIGEGDVCELKRRGKR